MNDINRTTGSELDNSNLDRSKMVNYETERKNDKVK